MDLISPTRVLLPSRRRIVDAAMLITARGRQEALLTLEHGAEK